MLSVGFSWVLPCGFSGHPTHLQRTSWSLFLALRFALHHDDCVGVAASISVFFVANDVSGHGSVRRTAARRICATNQSCCCSTTTRSPRQGAQLQSKGIGGTCVPLLHRSSKTVYANWCSSAARRIRVALLHAACVTCSSFFVNTRNFVLEDLHLFLNILTFLCIAC